MGSDGPLAVLWASQDALRRVWNRLGRVLGRSLSIQTYEISMKSRIIGSSSFNFSVKMRAVFHSHGSPQSFLRACRTLRACWTWLTVLASFRLIGFLPYGLTFLPSYRLAVLPSYRLAALPFSRLTALPSYRLAVLPSHRLAASPSYCLTAVPSYRLTVMPSCRLAVLPSDRLAALPFHRLAT